MATGDVTLTNKEPCYVIYDDSVMGLSETGDATIAITSDWTERTFQQTGSFPVEKYFNGAQVTLTATISEILHNAAGTTVNPNWLRVFPWATVMDTSDPYQRVVFSRGNVSPLTGIHIGQKGTDLAVAWKVVSQEAVNSYATTPAHTDRDFTIHQGLCTSVDGISFGNEAQVFSITVEGLYDPAVSTPGEGQQFATYGQVNGIWNDV